jgi:Mg/Co/Ni transporter MgtE
MPEPTSTAAVTLAATAVTVPALTAFGIPLGLRPDLLLAGFNGAIVAIILLNTVPGSSDTWRALIRLSFRRMAVAFASSLTAGYATPVVAGLFTSDPAMLSSAFVVGAGAQWALLSLIRRFQFERAPT